MNSREIGLASQSDRHDLPDDEHPGRGFSQDGSSNSNSERKSLLQGKEDRARIDAISGRGGAKPRSSAKSLYKRDLWLLSTTFLLVFLAFNTTQNLESSLNTALGTRVGMLAGLSGYWLFVAANLATLIPASIYLGFSAAILWVAEGAYIAAAAKGHAAACGLSEDATIGDFNGIFWSFFASNQVVGNLLAMLILQMQQQQQQAGPGGAGLTGEPGRGLSPLESSFPSLNGTLDRAYEYDGAARQAELTPDAAAGGGGGGVPLGTQRLLFATLLASMTAGTAIAFFLRPQQQHEASSAAPPAKVAGGGGVLPGGGGGGPGPVAKVDVLGTAAELARASVKLLGDRKMLCLVALLVYSGFQQAFIWGDFTKDIVTPALGIAWVGGIMAIFGASDALMERLFTFPKPLLFRSAWADKGTLVAAALLWGAGDAAFNTQISALLTILYPRDTEVAFAQWNTWQSAGTSLMFFISPHAPLYVKLGILFLGLAFAAAGLLAFESTTARTGDLHRSLLT
eukprot:jgi/Mesen1/4521/ME000023S03892